jgi:hypothetical protein
MQLDFVKTALEKEELHLLIVDNAKEKKIVV